MLKMILYYSVVSVIHNTTDQTKQYKPTQNYDINLYRFKSL